MYELIHATAPWSTGIEYNDNFMPVRSGVGKQAPRGTFHFHDALEYVKAHPGCSMKYLPTRDDKGNRYTPSKVFQALQYHSLIYIDWQDRIYPVEER